MINRWDNFWVAYHIKRCSSRKQGPEGVYSLQSTRLAALRYGWYWRKGW